MPSTVNMIDALGNPCDHLMMHLSSRRSKMDPKWNWTTSVQIPNQDIGHWYSSHSHEHRHADCDDPGWIIGECPRQYHHAGFQKIKSLPPNKHIRKVDAPTINPSLMFLFWPTLLLVNCGEPLCSRPHARSSCPTRQTTILGNISTLGWWNHLKPDVLV
jgi:hypothetical protein